MNDSLSNFNGLGDNDSFTGQSDLSNFEDELDAFESDTTSQFSNSSIIDSFQSQSVTQLSGMATCEKCGTIGIKHAFYSKNKRFCSLSCSRSFSAKKKSLKVVAFKKIIKEESDAKGNNSVNKLVVDKPFSWNEYLQRNDINAASVYLFKHCPLSDCWDVIGVGLKLEVPNYNVDLPKMVYWIATVVKLAGYKALLRYEGYESNNQADFWMNLCHEDIHEIGWTASTHNSLVPPDAIKNNQSNWREYLIKRLIGSHTLPKNFYTLLKKHNTGHGFRKGMLVEVIDKRCISAMKVAEVQEVMGGRLHLKYIQKDYDDFWCHVKSPLIHPVGWSERVGHKLHATLEYREDCRKKSAANKYGEKDSIESMFSNVKPYTSNMKFQAGMKLEAIDPLNLSAICVSSVIKVLRDDYLMIGMDTNKEPGPNDSFCYHSTSSSIFPAGFCEVNNIDLSPPKGYNKDTFRWEYYLNLMQSVAAPIKLFEKEIKDHGFRIGMKLEAVDLMDPRLICVGTVADVVGRLLRIRFDGWDSDYDQWIDAESPDLYPVGWCDLMNYSLEGPRVRDGIHLDYTNARRRKGKSVMYRGPRKKRKNRVPDKLDMKPFSTTDSMTNITIKSEPSSPKVQDAISVLSGQNNKPLSVTNIKASVSRDDNKILSTPVSLSLTTSRPALAATLLSPTITIANSNIQPLPTISSTTLKTIIGRNGEKLTTRSPSSSLKVVTHIPRFLIVDPEKSVSASSSMSLLSKSNVGTSSTAVTKGTTKLSQSIVPELWSVYNVSQFLKINDCGNFCESFSRNGIDGKKLLQLSEEQVATLTGMKVGQTLKVYELIQQLKSKITDSGSGAVRDAVSSKQN